MKSVLRPYWYFLKTIFRKTNQFFLKPFRALPISSENFGPPKGYYLSVSNWLQVNSEPGANYQEIYASDCLVRSPPKTLDSEVHWKFTLEYRRQIPHAFLAVIPQGRIWVNRGISVNNSAIITSNDRLLADLSLEFGKQPQDNLIFEQWKLPSVRVLSGNAVVLTMAKGEIYFHWMLDLLPKFKLLSLGNIDLARVDYFIVNSIQSSFQKETLGCIGIPEDKVLESTVYPHIKADRLIVPSLPSLSGNPTKWVCEFLREQFLSHNSSYDRTIDRLYISRKNARYRKVIDEDRICQFLTEKLGFETVALETLKVKEQAALFNRIKVIIAPHGAGLTNLVFCSPGTTVIEIFSPNYVNVCYYSLCQEIGLNYYYLIGEGMQPNKGIDPHFAGDNITIDMIKLQKIIEFAGVVSP